MSSEGNSPYDFPHARGFLYISTKRLKQFVAEGTLKPVSGSCPTDYRFRLEDLAELKKVLWPSHIKPFRKDSSV